jgi:E3 SUMO-protein ligase RanBP2
LTSTPKAPAFSFGGLTGNLQPSVPLIAEKPKEVDSTEKPKPSPFASFSFGQSANKSFSELFSGIAKTPTATPQVESEANKSASKDDDEVENYEPNVHFEPVIALPDLVEVKTGEEEEDVKFTHRAKLLRYDSTTKEWKERGIGEMKVLVTKNDASKARLLMRREQIFKLCCNMKITKELEFKKLNATTYSFGGQDFSENEVRKEFLAVKFKTADLIEQFLTAVKEIQKNLDKPTAAPKIEEKKSTETKGFGDAFKPKAGSWTCEGCYISNKPDVLYCVACDSPKDSTVPKKEAKSAFAPDPNAPSFSFGMPNSSGFSFGMPAAADSTTKSPELPKPSTTSFSFGSAQSSNVAPKPTFVLGREISTPSSGFSFGGEKSFSFNMNDGANKENEVANVKKDGNDSAGFNFVFKKKSPAKKSPGKTRNDSVNSEGGGDEDENEYHEDEENQTYFTPVIPLPDKVEVKTGEEDEEVLYSHRAKLFKFTDKEWKERGIGDVKILKHKVTGKLR